MEIAILSPHLRGRGKCLPLRGHPLVTAQPWQRLYGRLRLGASTPSELMVSLGCGAEDESGRWVGEWVIGPWHPVMSALFSACSKLSTSLVLTQTAGGRIGSRMASSFTGREA